MNKPTEPSTPPSGWYQDYLPDGTPSIYYRRNPPVLAIPEVARRYAEVESQPAVESFAKRLGAYLFTQRMYQDWATWLQDDPPNREVAIFITEVILAAAKGDHEL
jgi:hypothetical protein